MEDFILSVILDIPEKTQHFFSISNREVIFEHSFCVIIGEFCTIVSGSFTHFLVYLPIKLYVKILYNVFDSE